jgi:hypothetical protein
MNMSSTPQIQCHVEFHDRPDPDPIVEIIGTLLQLTLLGVLVTNLFPGSDSLALEIPVLYRVLLFVLLMLIINRSAAAVLLVLFQGAIFLQEPAGRPDRSLVDLAIDAGCLLSVLFLVGLFDRYRRVVNRAGWWLVLRLIGAERATDVPILDILTAALNFLVRLSGRILQAGVLILVAGWILSRIPNPRHADLWMHTAADGQRMLAPGPLILTGVFAVLVLLPELFRRPVNTDQAGVVMQTSLMSLLYRDLRMIARKELKVRRQKYARRNQQEVAGALRESAESSVSNPPGATHS